jgi:acyl-CoA dehydrogenase
MCASILLEPSATRDRLTVDIFHGEGHEGLALLERAYALKIASHDVRERMRNARVHDVVKARQEGLITDAEVAQLEELAKAIGEAIAVNDFAPEEISPQHAATRNVLSPPIIPQSAAE